MSVHFIMQFHLDCGKQQHANVTCVVGCWLLVVVFVHEEQFEPNEINHIVL